jgi:hypothetical protein
MWFALFSLSLLSGFLGSFEKSYGMLYINDDAFLAVAATLQNVMNGTSRIVWGRLTDILGYRVSVLFE